MRNFTRPGRTFALSATSFVLSLVATLFVISILAACAGRPVSSAPGFPGKKTGRTTMRAFGSEDELKNYFRQLAEERKRELAKGRSGSNANAPAPTAAAAQSTSLAKSSGEGYAA